MTPIKTAICASAIALIAAAPASAWIGYDVAEARDTAIVGQSFDAELARQYRAFALYEADDMVDWIDADHFAAKALAAAEGARPQPEQLDEWSLDRPDAEELAQAGINLVTALDGGAREDHPKEAAIAQAKFDCWVEQQEEDWQLAHIAACKRDFYAAMADLERVYEAPKQVGTVWKPITEGTVVYFDHDSSQLRPEGVDKLAGLARRLDDDREIVVTVTGHADRSGPTDYNEALSAKRADTVTDAVMALGLTPAEIDELDVEAKGETAPAVPTPDGVREQANRRVEIQAFARTPVPADEAQVSELPK